MPRFNLASTSGQARDGAQACTTGYAVPGLRLPHAAHQDAESLPICARSPGGQKPVQRPRIQCSFDITRNPPPHQEMIERGRPELSYQLLANTSWGAVPLHWSAHSKGTPPDKMYYVDWGSAVAAANYGAQLSSRRHLTTKSSPCLDRRRVQLRLFRGGRPADSRAASSADVVRRNLHTLDGRRYQRHFRLY